MLCFALFESSTVNVREKNASAFNPLKQRHGTLKPPLGKKCNDFRKRKKKISLALREQFFIEDIEPIVIWLKKQNKY